MDREYVQRPTDFFHPYVLCAALAVVLSDPLQTLIDSACVGQQSTLQLAALGPNTAVFNSVTQLFSFLGIATANIIATHSLTTPGLTVDEVAHRRHTSETALCSAILLAITLGIVATSIMRIYGPVWMTQMGTDPAVLPLACNYLVVRAIALPAVFIMTVCQGACLGLQDTMTPMWVCLAGTGLNLIGDIALVYGAGLGVTGAASATVLAQVCAASYFVMKLRSRRRRDTKGEQKNSGSSNSGGRCGVQLRWTVRSQSIRSAVEIPLKKFKSFRV